MNWAAKQRQIWIAARLHEIGYINRADIMDEFEISIPQASIDLRRFQEANPGVVVYNKQTKRYERQW